MEYFDILNEDGSVSGRLGVKGQNLSEDEYYVGAHAYIHNSEGKFLLQKRAMDKEFLPGGWDIHMGHVMAGESSEIAIRREIQEELGLNVEDIVFLKRVLWKKYNHFIDIFVVCEDIHIDNLKLQKSEVDDVKYVSKDDMIRLISKMDYRPEEYREVMKSYVNSIS